MFYTLILFFAVDVEVECWEDNNEQLEKDFPSNDSEMPDLPLAEDISIPQESALVTWLILFLVRLQSKFYLPDTAVSCLLKFLYAFLCIIGRHSTFVARISTNFPTSVFLLKKYFGWKETFVRYVVCCKCYSVYEYKKCTEKIGTQVVSKKCHYRSHPNSSHNRTCNTLLLKTVHLQSGMTKLIPYKTYCYNSLQASLQKLLLYPGFVELCEQWRTHNEQSSLTDIFDGKIWKDFQYIGGQPYLASPYVYACMINIDWFQPYKHTTASVGAIYLTILNLPCTKRYKREYTMLLGVIPGPSEPDKNILNQFLRPLVKELQEFFIGIPMKVHSQNDQRVVKCILIGVACDIPAGRKVCGFLGHSACLGCSRCLKKFPGGVGSKDYSGFERRLWKLRSNQDHRSSVRLTQKSKNMTERVKLESKYGCRYSVLLELSYFDPVRMLVIDPMHNLFLGTAKHMIKIWKDRNVLCKSHFESIQKKVDSFRVPSDIGRIPRKVETNFSGFTADQYKNWTIFYSIPCLFEVIDSNHLECWRHFVLACRLLCRKIITITDVNMADALLLQFCRRVEQTYGKSAITPNMHLHCHLRDVILDFGPIYSFWLFSYERFNGILQHQPTNNHCIEIQVMRRFIEDNIAYAFQPPDNFHDELAIFCDCKPSVTGSLLLTESHTSCNLVELPSSYTYHVFTDYELRYLKMLLAILLKVPSDEVNLNSMCQQFKVVHINGLKYPCSSSKLLSVATTHWDESLFGRSPTVLPAMPFNNPSDASLRPFKIEYFAKASYSVRGDLCTRHFTCAVISWFEPHPSRFKLGKPVQIWCKDLFECPGIYSFLPFDNIYFANIYRSVHAYMKLDNLEDVFVVLPILV